LALAGHGAAAAGPLFRPVKNNRTAEKCDRPLDPASVYRNIVRHYGLATGICGEVSGLCVHSLRATAATNALSHQADIAKVQEWLGHANVSTTRLYDRRKSKPGRSGFSCEVLKWRNAKASDKGLTGSSPHLSLTKLKAAAQ